RHVDHPVGDPGGGSRLSTKLVDQRSPLKAASQRVEIREVGAGNNRVEAFGGQVELIPLVGYLAQAVVEPAAELELWHSCGGVTDLETQGFDLREPAGREHRREDAHPQAKSSGGVS